MNSIMKPRTALVSSNFLCALMKGRTRIGDVHIDERIILKHTLGKCLGGCGLNSFGFECGPFFGLCGRNYPLCSIKGGVFLDYVSNC